MIESRRVFIEAIRTIEPGEELGYDYQLTWESTDDPEELALYECRCGAPQCRGTMLDATPLDQKKTPPRRPASSRAQPKSAGRTAASLPRRARQ